MLKNKFSVLKSIALALVLVMAVAVFAACGDKGDDSAVSSALEELSKQAYESSVELSKQQSIQDASIKAAAEEQSKKLEEQSKKLEEQSKKASEEQSKKEAEESKKLSSILSSIDQSNKDAATATTAPGAAEDLSTLMSELAELRAKYQYAYADYYIGDNHAKVIKVLDLATYQLGNAKTLAAGKDILAQAKVDLAAIENAVTVANAFNAQVEALGDIEADVFTTAAEKVNAARKAYNKFVKDYTSAKVTSSAWVKELGLAATVADLNKAELKLDALAEYMEESLTRDMATLYTASGNKVREPKSFAAVLGITDNKVTFYTADGMKVEFTVNATTTYADVVASAYYKYQVLAVVNGGSTVDANLATGWENKYNEAGKKDGLDYTKPSAYFTTEELVEYYILPYAEEKFDAYKTAWINKLTATAKDDTVKAGLLDNTLMLASTKVGTVTLAKADLFKNVDVDVRDIVNAFEDELDALTFAKDFKASSTLEEADYALFVRAALAYVNAVNEAVANFKEAALENASDKVDDAIRALDEDKPVEAAKIANLQAAITEFTAKVKATKGYDSTTIFDDAVIAAYRSAKKDKTLKDLATILAGATDLNAAFGQAVTYVNNVEALAIANGFKGVTGGGSGYDTSDAELKELVLAMIDDLNAFKDNYTQEDGRYYTADLRGDYVAFSDPADDNRVNDAKIAALAKSVDEYIAKLKAIKVEDYKNEKVALKTSKDKEIGSAKKGSAIYFVSEAAYNKAVADGLYVDENDYNYAALLRDKYLTTSKTKFPLQYTYTAGEHAIMEASSVYNAAFKDFAAQLIAIRGWATSAVKALTADTQVKNLLAATAGTDLNKEINALVTKYTNDINGVTTNVTGATKNDAATTYDHVTTKAVTTGATLDYNSYNTAITNAKNAFLTGETTKAMNLVTLWDYKVAKVAELKELVATVTATYELKKAGEGAVATDKLVLAAKATTTTYNFASTYCDAYIGYSASSVLHETAPSTKDTVFETALSKLVEDYEAKIMAVTFNNTALTIKDWTGTVTVLNGVKGNWTLAGAQSQVNGYVTDFKGTAAKTKVLEGTTVIVENAAGCVDSRIFKAWFDTFATSHIYTNKTLG